MELFGGDGEKVKQLERLIAEEMGFKACVPVSGQTYSRKTDAYIAGALSGIAQSAQKFANDLRILQSFEEMEEPFEKNQIGSSAMPYKRNPMRSERICALSRYVCVDALNPALTSSVQWFERTLDDSANRRIAMAEAFLAVDAILNIYVNVSAGLVVNEKVDRPQSRRKTAVYGYRKRDDGIGKTRRKPSGTSRNHTCSFARRRPRRMRSSPRSSWCPPSPR